MKLRNPLLIGALASMFVVLAQVDGCDEVLPEFPTTEQVDLYIPEAMRSCPDMPDSPGENATQKQTALYIAQLYNVAKACGFATKQVDQLYERYRVQVEKLTK